MCVCVGGGGEAVFVYMHIIDKDPMTINLNKWINGLVNGGGTTFPWGEPRGGTTSVRLDIMHSTSMLPYKLIH